MRGSSINTAILVGGFRGAHTRPNRRTQILNTRCRGEMLIVGNWLGLRPHPSGVSRLQGITTSSWPGKRHQSEKTVASWPAGLSLNAIVRLPAAGANRSTVLPAELLSTGTPP